MAGALDPSSGMTCITCRVVFARGELQRDHYKTDWHRYNLKRKVAELPPIDAEQFQKRVLAHRAQVEQESEQEAVPNRCISCNKTFQSQNAYDNHLNAKKHKELAAIFERDGPPKAKRPSKKAAVKTVAEEKEEAVTEVEMAAPADADGSGEEEGEWTDAESDDEQMDLTERPGAIPSDTCLFCLAQASTLEQNLEHMSKKHGFYIPDLEFCSDLDGLVKYLGAKVGAGFMCLWCNERGRRFRSLDACQKHMRDKGHCRAAHEGSDMLELADYYDFSSMYPEEQGDQEVRAPVELLDDSGWQLQLPSGATVGHRELMRYYRQRLKPEGPETRNQKRGRDAIQKVMGQYKSLGWIGTTGEMAVRKARDVKFMQRIQSKSYMRLGVKASKLFHYETYC
uniref:C2H2-type domain-containing protein n=1 Tax=Plectus sambesii TaxID=2011161 RepID=A0A914V5D7_9BILA